MSISMEQKEAAWSAWWYERTRLIVDDGSRSSWEKEQAVVREKKQWWYSTYGVPYWTQEDKELQWLGYCDKAKREPYDGPEKVLWWHQAFGEQYVPMAIEDQAALRTQASMRAQVERMSGDRASRAAVPWGRPLIKNPVLFGCPSCQLLFVNRTSCDKHAQNTHGVNAEAQVLFHPEATVMELKACLFVNMPWTDKAMLSPTVRSSDMDLCYVTKRLVLKAPESYDWSDDPYQYN
jgi:hypothetical protein